MFVEEEIISFILNEMICDMNHIVIRLGGMDPTNQMSIHYNCIESAKRTGALVVVALVLWRRHTH